MNDQQRIDLARAEHAQRILNDDMVKEAFAAIEDGIVAAWKDVPLRDVEGREHLHRLLQAKRKFEAVFAAHIQNGAIAANELKAEAERQSIIEKAKRYIHRG